MKCPLSKKGELTSQQASVDSYFYPEKNGSGYFFKKNHVFFFGYLKKEFVFSCVTVVHANIEGIALRYQSPYCRIKSLKSYSHEVCTTYFCVIVHAKIFLISAKFDNQMIQFNIFFIL